MKIRFGYELVYAVRQPSPMILMLHSQPNRDQYVVKPDVMCTSPEVPLSFYTDPFGNTCTRLEAPAGSLRLTTDAIMEDCGTPEPAQWSAQEHAVRDLPEHTLQYLLASRYCETDLLMADAWRRCRSQSGRIVRGKPRGTARSLCVCAPAAARPVPPDTG